MTGIAPRFAWLPGKMRRSSSRLPSQLLYVVGWFCAQLVWVVRDDLVGDYGPFGGRKTTLGYRWKTECVAFVGGWMTGIAPRLAWLPGKMMRLSSRLPSQLL